MSKKWFWDIETYQNLFLVGFLSDKDDVELHYLVNNEHDEQRVKQAMIDLNKKETSWRITLYDLSKDANRLNWHFKHHIPALSGDTLLSNFLGTKQESITPKEDVYFGFNTLHYDIPMIDYVLQQVIGGRLRTTTEQLRKHSTDIIEGNARPINTLAYEQYANQVDIAHLDDSFLDAGKLTIGLKTLVGTLGGSILESEANKTGISKDVYEETIYNFNDITEMKRVVFDGTKIETTYNTRKSLLEEYSDRLLPNNVTVNSTSATFVEHVIAPNDPIVDSPTVSFIYPAKHIAEEKGVEQFNVLEYTKEWYIKNVYKSVVRKNPKQAKYLIGKFLSIYHMYKKIEGENWNDSSRHKTLFGIEAQPKEERRKLMETFGTYLPLVDANGVDSGSYVNFSLGGIHGAEVDKKQLEKDRALIKELKRKYRFISKIPKSEKVDKKLMNIIKNQSRKQYQDYPNRLLHEVPYFWKEVEQSDEIIEPDDFSPFGVVVDKGRAYEKLIKRYHYISSALTIHQDFAGYYPMLLINLGVFYNGVGIDEYKNIYEKRIAIKSKLKTLIKGSTEYIITNLTQDGYKLILNSASGILDAGYDTKCRANNKAMAMRIIGQLFTFIIAQALALEGANVPSSNTDGIYVSNIDIKRNTEIVNRELEKLLVTIDPHEVFLVSKDTNNRLEIEDGKVSDAKGGTLTSHGGPRVDKRLSHPALCDAVLAMYLNNEDIINKPFNKKLLDDIYEKVISQYDKRQMLIMAGWVMRPTNGSLFIVNEDKPIKQTIRSFLTTDGSNIKRYNTQMKRPSINFDEEADLLTENEPMGKASVVQQLKALKVLDHWKDTITVKQYKEEGLYQQPNNERKHLASVPMLSDVKIAGLPETSKITIDNRSLYELSDSEMDTLYHQLDHESYKEMIANSFALWQNEEVI